MAGELGCGQSCGSCQGGGGVLPGVRPRCSKCKEGVRVRAQVVANQTEALCLDCLRNSLLARFKTAVNSSGLWNGGDRVLVAFSGGAASRVALDFLLEMRRKAQSDADGSKEHKLAVFDVGAAFVDEAALLGISENQAAGVREEIRDAVLSGSERLTRLHIEALESAFLDWSETGVRPTAGDVGSLKRQLVQLFEAVHDASGKEDLQVHLRMLVLQQIARAHGYTKLILGLCTSRIAAHVISATAKGQGFALPAGIQYFDARFDVPVLLPLRDCIARELTLYCHLAKLTTVFVRKLSTLAGNHSINSLAHSFVTMLQEENPAREHTIVRTALKLKPFAFNDTSSRQPSRRRCPPLVRCQTSVQVAEVQAEQEPETSILCPLCLAPVDRRDLPRGTDVEKDEADAMSSAHGLRITCCPSCRFQLLPEEDLASTFTLLPSQLKQQRSSSATERANWMRSQVADYLLPDESVPI